MIFAVGLLALSAIALYTFVSPKFSPIPYYPTLNREIKLIDQALDLKKGDILIDLGAGDGKMLWRYARAGVKVIGVEINPFLCAYMWLRRWRHPYRQNIIIQCQDLFKSDITNANKIYLFVGPILMERIIEFIKQYHGPKLTKVISYRYDFVSRQSGQKLIPARQKTILKGKQNVYIWNID